MNDSTNHRGRKDRLAEDQESLGQGQPVAKLSSGRCNPNRMLITFRADRMTYWRDHAWLAAIAMAIGMGILWAMGNPDIWTGALGGLFAVAVRAFYLASDEATAEWILTETEITGPENRRIRLDDIARVRTLGSAVQLITLSGDKHLMKYMADRAGVAARIEAEMARLAA